MVRDGVLTENSTEQERYNYLKDAEITVAQVNEKAIKGVNLEEYNTRKKSAVTPGLVELANKLGILNVDLKNSKIEFPFQYSAGNLRKSIHHQLEYGGTYQDYVKAMSCFKDLIENAVPIEVHGEKKTGTARENKDLKRVYVLVSGYTDGKFIVPVQLEVKTFWTSGSKLYLTVALTKIDSGVLEEAFAKKAGTPLLFPESTYSLQSILKNVNPKDGRFLKYIPDGFLNAEQMQAKQNALERQWAEYAGYGGTKQSGVSHPTQGQAKLDDEQTDPQLEKQEEIAYDIASYMPQLQDWLTNEQTVEQTTEQYAEQASVDPSAQAIDQVAPMDLDTEVTPGTATPPKTAGQTISEIADKIQKPGITSGKARIAAQQMYTEAEKYGPHRDIMLEAYNAGQDPKRFADGFQNAYISGTLGNHAALENSKAAAYLTEEQRELAYGLGASSKNKGMFSYISEEGIGKTHLSVENVAQSSTIKKGNIEVRRWYIDRVREIPNLIDKAASDEERARRAFEERNRIRTEAREMMADQETRIYLDMNRPNITFEELIESKMRRKGMTREEVIRDIYVTATKTNEGVNKELGVGGKQGVFL